MVARMTRSIQRHRLASVLMIAGVYGYFLLFSQFAFLEWVQSAVHVEWRIKLVLGAMALCGVVGAIVAKTHASLRWYRISCVGCVVAAGASLYARDMVSLAMVSATMGLALGVATVSLAALLPRWLTGKDACLWVGIGTGLGYALCNVPALFLASPAAQALCAGAMMLVSCVASGILVDSSDEPQLPVLAHAQTPQLLAAVLVFFALVWFDSGAFYVIQHVPELKKATWGAENLWRNAGLHFFAAVLAGHLLTRGLFRSVILTATILLALAAVWVNHAGTRIAAGWLYPIAVSFYSTALVCWPGLLSPRADAKKRAAWVFAVAGWIGSAMGIGMVEKLHIVPLWFVIAASLLIVTCLFSGQWRRLLGILGFVFLSITIVIVNQQFRTTSDQSVERGKQVYLAEGCIHCHSQYLRPNRRDESYWGLAKQKKEILEEAPVLIGNRRQGPDLTHVSGRRSDAWLRAHFIAPRSFAPHSPMPSYAHLFEDGRGEDLIAYLTRDRDVALPMVQERWQQAAKIPDGPKDLARGKQLFADHCAVCHGVTGQGDGPVAQQMGTPVANLVKGPFRWTQSSIVRDPDLIDRVIRFGIPGTDMPGHETWTDEQVRSLRAWVIEMYQP